MKFKELLGKIYRLSVSAIFFFSALRTTFKWFLIIKRKNPNSLNLIIFDKFGRSFWNWWVSLTRINNYYATFWPQKVIYKYIKYSSNKNIYITFGDQNGSYQV